MKFSADGVEGRQLRLGIERAQLRGLGEIDHAGEGHVVVGLVGVKAPAVVPHGVGGELPVLPGQGDHLVAGELDGPGLVDADMAGVRGDHALPAIEQGGDGHGVGLGAAHQEIHVRPGLPAGGADLLPGGGAEAILPVAGLGNEIGFSQTLQDPGMGALGIVAQKVQHVQSSLRFLRLRFR